jgi:hypothetical protein
MAKLIYQHPDDNLADDATAITPSTENSLYPIENVYDKDPSKPFRMLAVTGNIVWEFTSPENVDLLFIHGHNLEQNLEVRLQANSSNSWGAPPLNQLITIPEWELDENGERSVDAFLDLTSITPRSYAFWRLVVVGSNPSFVSLGEVWLGETKRSLNVDILYDVEEKVRKSVIQHVTEYDTDLFYRLGVKIKHFEAEIQALTPTALKSLRDWWDSCDGPYAPTPVYYDTEADDVYGPVMVRFMDAERTDSHKFPNITNVKLIFKEASRGVVL